MKKLVIISVLIVIAQSCSNFNFGNFNKQKYTKLKTISSKHVKVKHNKEVSFKNDYKRANLIENQYDVYLTDDLIEGDSISSESKFKEEGDLKRLKKKNKTVIKQNNLTKALASKNQQKSRVTKSTLAESKQKVNGLFFFLILLGFPLMFIKNIGFRISKWAGRNVKKAQVLIGGFTITGLFSSFLLGSIVDFNITNSMFVAPVILGLGSLVVNNVKTKRRFLTKKLSVSMLSMLGLFLTFCAGNSTSFYLLESVSDTAVHPVLAVFLTLLIIALLALSIFGIVALSCSLSCGGAPFLASIVLFGGTILFLFLAILAIYHLFKQKETPETEKERVEPIKEESKPKKDIKLILLIIILSLLLVSIVL